MMKKCGVLLLTVFLILNLTGTAGAFLVTQTMTATLSSVNPSDLTGLTMGETYEIFTVVYDNEGTVMHEFYYSNDEIYRTYNLPQPIVDYDFYSDAVFTFSDELSSAIANYTGAPPLDTWYSIVYHNSANYYNFGYYYENISIYGSWNPNPMYNSGIGFFGFLNNDGWNTVSLASWSLSDPIPVAPVSEPTTILLLGSGIVGLIGFRRRFTQ